MTHIDLSSVAHQIVDGFDSNAHRAIDFWREGGTRLAQLAADRWDTAFAESRDQLDAETRRNATHARKVFAGYYNKGLSLSTGGAEVAVDTVVQAARTAIERAEAWRGARTA